MKLGTKNYANENQLCKSDSSIFLFNPKKKGRWRNVGPKKCGIRVIEGDIHLKEVPERTQQIFTGVRPKSRDFLLKKARPGITQQKYFGGHD